MLLNFRCIVFGALLFMGLSAFSQIKPPKGKWEPEDA